MKGKLSPMTDSTSNYIPIDYGSYAETVEKLFLSVTESDIFNETLALFERTALKVDTYWNEETPHQTTLGALRQAAESLVAAAAHYHYANVLFDVLTELEDIQKASGEAVQAETKEE